MPYPLADFDLKTRIYPACIRTQRLIPGMENAELSFRQKTQKLLGSSKVPLLWYNVHVDYPAVIQLENPIPIPFKVRVVINRQRTSDIIVDVPQKIELKITTHNSSKVPRSRTLPVLRRVRVAMAMYISEASQA